MDFSTVHNAHEDAVFAAVQAMAPQYPALAGAQSIAWKPETFQKYDAILISTAHSSINYDELVRNSQLVIDTRNATHDVRDGREKIFKA